MPFCFSNMMHLRTPIFLTELQKVVKAEYYLQCSSLNQRWTNKSALWAPGWCSTGLGANQLWPNAEYKISVTDPESLSCYGQEEAKIKLGATTAAPFISTRSSYHSRVSCPLPCPLQKKTKQSFTSLFFPFVFHRNSVEKKKKKKSNGAFWLLFQI